MQPAMLGSAAVVSCFANPPFPAAGCANALALVHSISTDGPQMTQHRSENSAVANHVLQVAVVEKRLRLQIKS
jgi:hypothetical protein